MSREHKPRSLKNCTVGGVKLNRKKIIVQQKEQIAQLQARIKAVLEICDRSKSFNIHHEDCNCSHCVVTRILKEKS